MTARISRLFSPQAAYLFTAIFSPFLFVMSGLMAAPLFLLIALWALGTRLFALPVRHVLRDPLYGILAVIALLAFFSLGTTPAPYDHAFSSWTRLCGLLAMSALILSQIRTMPLPDETRFSRYLAIGLFFSVGLAYGEAILQGGLAQWLDHHLSKNANFQMHYLNRGMVALAVWVWVVVAMLHGNDQKGWAVFALATTFLAILLMQSATAKLAVLAGICIAGFAYAFRRHAYGWMLAGLAALFCFVPALFLIVDASTLVQLFPALPPSLQHRFYIWEFAMEHAAMEPFFGWGLKASNFIPRAAAPIEAGGGMVWMPLHPHNNLLHIWLELGLVGVVAFVGLCTLILRRIGMMADVPDFTRACCYGMLFSSLVVGMAGYGVWQSWWISVNVLAAGMMILTIRFQRRRVTMPA